MPSRWIALTASKADLYQEVRPVGNKIVNVYIQEGRMLIRQETLIRMLRLRFGDLPQTIADAIEGCSDIAQLDSWLDKLLTARRLSDMNIIPKA